MCVLLLVVDVFQSPAESDGCLLLYTNVDTALRHRYEYIITMVLLTWSLTSPQKNRDIILYSEYKYSIVLLQYYVLCTASSVVSDAVMRSSTTVTQYYCSTVGSRIKGGQ